MLIHTLEVVCVCGAAVQTAPLWLILIISCWSITCTERWHTFSRKEDEEEAKGSTRLGPQKTLAKPPLSNQTCMRLRDPL